MSMPVSGPGKFSQRTDRQPIRDPGGLPYGEGQALHDTQAAAPMATSAQPGAAQAVGLRAPSANTAQPVTAGAAAGAGPGEEVLGPQPLGQPAGGAISQAIARAAASDPSGALAQLLVIAQSKGL